MDERERDSLTRRQLTRRHLLRTGTLAAGGAVAAGLAARGTVGAAPVAPGRTRRTTHQSAGTLTIGQPAPFQFMDPQRTYLSSESSTHQSIFDTLVSFDDSAQFRPLLATEWSSTGPTEWTFKLRQGVTFHNGEVFNAEVVRWNVERITEPGFQDFAFMAPVDHAEVVDEYTIKIVTKKTHPTLPNLMSQFFIVSPQAMANGVDEFVKQPIGTGPYKFVDWVPDDHVRVEANESYWGGAPTIKEVVWRVMPEASTRVAALQAGEIQVLKDLPSDQYDIVDEADGIRATEVRSVRTPYLRFFPDSPQGGGEPFKDKRVRQAFNYAINIDSIITNLLGGHAERMATTMTPEMFGYDPAIQPYAYDLEKAKQLMTEAGFADGFEITFETWSAGPAPKPVELAQAVAADLAKINVKATVKPVELGTALKAQVDKTISPFGLWSWGGNGFDGDTKFWGIYHTDSSSTFMTDQTMIDLIEAEQATTVPEERKAIFSQLQQHAVEEAFIVPLFAQMDTYGVSDSVTWTARHDELVLPYYMTLTS
ncbi:MAG: peptide/nickel transport system substrate-binding protein [Thermomicrobiales bacterium]|jgi:peptide/nickel transport system substrate-binding protein|nr:peptide/nickel transport system substrate-binding protein [Thermomicrobiales bacterium]